MPGASRYSIYIIVMEFQTGQGWHNGRATLGVYLESMIQESLTVELSNIQFREGWLRCTYLRIPL